jgi:hypothetical protein
MRKFSAAAALWLCWGAVACDQEKSARLGGDAEVEQRGSGGAVLRFPLHKTPHILDPPRPGTKFKGLQVTQDGLIIHDYANAQYYGEVAVGAEGPYRVIFDTGSSNLWVPGKDCGLLSCGLHTRYSSAASPTYQPDGRPFEVMYGSGPVSGFISSDNVQLGEALTAEGQLFAEVTDASGLGLAYLIGKFDGILGMGFDSISVGGYKPVFRTLMDQQKLSRGVFAFYLSSSDDVDGELVLGGIDESHFKGDLNWVPVVDPSYWQVDLDSVDYDGSKLLLQEGPGMRAIIDTGTSLIAGPSDAVQAFAEAAGATQMPGTAGAWVLSSCDKNSVPSLSFTFGGFTYHLAGDELVIDSGAGACILGVMGLDAQLPGPPGTQFWILGDVFLRRWYTVFDMEAEQIGFAESM